MGWENKTRWVHELLAVRVTRTLVGKYLLTGLDYAREREWIICETPSKAVALRAQGVIAEKLKPEEVHRLKDMSCEEILRPGGAK